MKLRLHPLEEGSKTQLLNVTERPFEFLGIGISNTGLYITDDVVENFKKTFTNEILNSGIINEHSIDQVIRSYREFASGWVNHYKKICPDDFERVEKELLVFLDNFVEKHRTRKTVAKFCGYYRFTLSGPFIRIKG